VGFAREKRSLKRSLRISAVWTRKGTIIMGKKLSGAQKRKKKKEREEAIKEAAADLERLKLGPTEIWTGLVLHHKDIFVSHVISKLNSTDIKFLYEVHSETRKLIKRSSRAGDLKKKFKVEEMSSISTLEVAWEHKSLWPSWWDETTFCHEVAWTNKLELLKWMREEKKCEWDWRTICAAAGHGNMEMVKYCVANKCPITADACACAAENGHLECLKYLHEEVKAPWDSSTASRAALNGHLHILEYLVERKYDQYSGLACENAAENGHLDCLVYLHETAKAPWNSYTADGAALNGHLHILEYLVECKYDKYNALACRFAAVNGHLDCLKYLHEIAKAPWDKEVVRKAYETAKEPGKYLTARDAPETDLAECVQYLLDNDCPIPLGWRYEDGELHVPESDPE